MKMRKKRSRGLLHETRLWCLHCVIVQSGAQRSATNGLLVIGHYGIWDGRAFPANATMESGMAGLFPPSPDWVWCHCIMVLISVNLVAADLWK